MFKELVFFGSFSSVLLLISFSMVLTDVSGQAGGQGCPFSATLPEGFVRYENPSFGVTICHPSTWKIVQENSAVGSSASDIIVAFTPTGGAIEDNIVLVNRYDFATFSLSPDTLSTISPELLMEGLIRIAKSTFSDFNVIEQDTAHSVLSDHQAVRLVATVTLPTPSGPTSGKAMLIYTVIGDKMYGVSFGGKDYDTYFPLVEQMVGSFKVQ